LSPREDEKKRLEASCAVVAKRLGSFVDTTDPHFNLVPDLKRYWPNK